MDRFKQDRQEIFRGHLAPDIRGARFQQPTAVWLRRLGLTTYGFRFSIQLAGDKYISARILSGRGDGVLVSCVLRLQPQAVLFQWVAPDLSLKRTLARS